MFFMYTEQAEQNGDFKAKRDFLSIKKTWKWNMKHAMCDFTKQKLV